MEKKEAMKILKDFHDKSALFSIRTALDTIIPELKESEDERIREKLIENFKWFCGDFPETTKWGKKDDDLLVKDILAWLEKQGEQKPAEWSAEDALRLEEVICMTEANGRWVRSDDAVKSVLDWLKSLKERVLPKQEWSKEDGQYLLVCKNALTKYQASDKWDARIISHWLENKLKAPQKRWKPSDEQMKALNYVVNLMALSESPKENDYYYNVFKDLRKQLKKLMEK